jgi:hypothetical protein
MIGLAFGQAITLAAEIAAALMEAKAVENRKPLGQEATPNNADRKHITSGPKPQALVATASGHGVQPVFFVEKASSSPRPPGSQASSRRKRTSGIDKRRNTRGAVICRTGEVTAN